MKLFLKEIIPYKTPNLRVIGCGVWQGLPYNNIGAYCSILA